MTTSQPTPEAPREEWPDWPAKRLDQYLANLANHDQPWWLVASDDEA